MQITNCEAMRNIWIGQIRSWPNKSTCRRPSPCISTYHSWCLVEWGDSFSWLSMYFLYIDSSCHLLLFLPSRIFWAKKCQFWYHVPPFNCWSFCISRGAFHLKWDTFLHSKFLIFWALLCCNIELMVERFLVWD